MKIYLESAILDDTDEPTREMLALWHQLCRNVLNDDLEVGVANRHECELTKNFKGELNTAIPMPVNGKTMLILLFENTASVKNVILTHELGHWILKLQGFRAVQKPSQPHSNNEIMLNSMCQHPALYALQKSVGHDPQHEIDERARHDLSILKPEPFALLQSKPSPPNNKISFRTLLYSDDILNCSDDISEALLAKLGTYFPDDASCVRDICSIRDSFDPAKLDSHPAFVRAVMRQFGFGAEWVILDEIPWLKKLASGKG